MTKNEFDSLYVGHKRVVNCRTQREAKDFLKLAHSFGYIWASRHSLIDVDNWWGIRESTCYEISNRTTIWDLRIAKTLGYTIVPYYMEVSLYD